MMLTVAHAFIPAPVHAGGLGYHVMAPSISALLDQGEAEARSYHQNACFDAALSFIRAEGHIVAPETAHAVKATYDEAMACKESGESKVILFNASGHGHFDLAAYDAYLREELPDDFRGGDHLLTERQIESLRDPHPGRARDQHIDGRVPHISHRFAQCLAQCLDGASVVAKIRRGDDAAVGVEEDRLGGR